MITWQALSVRPYCKVEFTMANYGAPASVMLFSADELLNDPVAYTLLGRATFTGAW